MILRRGLLSISFVIAALAGYSQTPGLAWVGVFEGDNSKSVHQVAVDFAGNVYTVGHFFENLDVDPLTDEHIISSLGSFDAFVVKQNSLGEFQWVVHVGSLEMQSASTVNVDANGDIIVSGYFEGTVDFEPGLGVTQFTSPSVSAFVMKLNTNGGLIWAKAFNNTDGDSNINALTIDLTNNNIFIAGQITGTADADPSPVVSNLVSAGSIDIWVAKFSPDGNLVSASSAGGPGDDYPTKIAIDNDEQIIVTGMFSETTDLDPGPGIAPFTASSAEDAFILKLDNSLNFVWGKQVTTTSQFYVGNIDTDPANNNIIFNGSLYGSADFDPGTGAVTLTSGGDSDFFVASYTPSGDLNWAKKAGSLQMETGLSMAVDESGNIIMAGRYSATFDVDPDGAVIDLIPASNQGWNMYLTKFNNNGELLWYHPIPSGDIIDPYYLTLDNDDNIYIVGDWNEEVNFSSNTCVDGNRVTHDNALPFVVKYNAISDIACFGFLEQPESNVVGCENQRSVFSALAAGTSSITYQWQRFNGSVWVDVTDEEEDTDNNENGYAGSKTPYFDMFYVPGGEEGDYRCVVNGDGVTTIYSNTVSVDVIPRPPVPGVVATSGCGPGNYALQAIGQPIDFKWYIGDLDDGSFENEELIDGESGDSFTHFFDENAAVGVSQTNSGCEGDKALVIINTETCAQPPGLVWAERLSPGLIEPTSMVIDGNNDVYIAGQFYSTVDFDPGTGTFPLIPNGTDDYFVAKYSPSGTLYWAVQTDMSIFDMDIGTDDDLYYVGDFQGTVDFNPGTGTFPMTAAGTSQDIAIVELHADDGTFSWAKQIAGSSNENANFARGIAIGPVGTIHITGSFTRTMDFNPAPGGGAAVVNLTSASTAGPDIFVAKYDQDGGYLWAKRMGSTAFVERGNDITVDASGNVYTVGVYQTTVDFDPNAGSVPLGSAGATDAFIQKLNSIGDLVWAKRIGGGSADQALTVDLDAAGNPVIGGHFNGLVDFDPNGGTFNLSSNGQPSFILKLAADGTLLWAKASGGTLENILVTPGNLVLITGVLADDEVDFDPGPSTYNLGTAVDSDAFLSQLDASGNFLWAYNTNASGLGYFPNEGTVVAVDGTGDIYLTGFFTNTADFDPTNCTYPMSTSDGSRELFIQKVRPALATICFVRQPEEVIGCDGKQVVLTTEATGTTNITYKWQKYNTSFSYFEDITPAPGYGGINTRELTISATATFGEGTYRVIAKGDNASDQSSSGANITVAATPAPPTTVPESFCSPGVKVLAVAGGTNGDYRWYEDISGEPVADAVDDTFVTRFLNSTTTYFATRLVNGCESDFQTVNATINLNVAPPAVIDGVSCASPASVTLTAAGATGGNNYYWYETAQAEDVMIDDYEETFQTPVLPSTTSYYVAIGDGICESLRVEVVAQIGSATNPTGSTVSNCGPGAVTLTADGGVDGNYRWYTQASGGTAITAAVNGSYVTPTLTSTTQYFVSIDDGSCESMRALATAVIDALPAAPTAGGATVCTNASATLIAASGTTGTFNWYAAATGGSPVHTGASFTTPNLAVATTYHVSIFDTECESTRTAVTVTVNNCATNAPPVIQTTTSSTGIEGTVSINLTPLLSDPDNNLDLTTLRIVIQPKSGAFASIDQNGQLDVDYSGVSFSGNDELTIEVCDNAGSCVQQVIRIRVSGEVEVFNAVSPNGDGKNDVLHLDFIDVIEETRVNKVMIFNRWGSLVFEVQNYNNTTNAFTGKNVNGNELPSGTYFYRIEFASGRTAKTGYLSLKR
jgi:gliding motility-associated-like protein